MSHDYDDTISGRLTRDPDIKARCVFLNIGKSEKIPNSDDYGPTLWIKIICFKTAAETAKAFKKGTTIRAYGKLGIGADWKDNTGTTRKGGVEFKCFKVEEYVKQRQRSEFDDDAPATPAPRRESSSRREDPPQPVDIPDDDLPF